MKPEGVSSVTEGRSLAGDGAKCDTEQTFGLTDGIPPGPMKKRAAAMPQPSKVAEWVEFHTGGRRRVLLYAARISAKVCARSP